jgi:hypothetical protein
MPLPVQDHYEVARARAVQRLAGRLGAERLAALGVTASADEPVLILPCLAWEFAVSTATWQVSLLPDGAAVSTLYELLALNYLGAEDPRPPHSFLSFADIAEGRGYQNAFDSRVIRRLTGGVGGDRQTLVEAVERLRGVPGGSEPLYCLFRFFPLVEFQVVRYAGEGDLPASCNVLLPDNLLSVFSMEDGIVAAERLISALEGRTPAAARSAS